MKKLTAILLSSFLFLGILVTPAYAIDPFDPSIQPQEETYDFDLVFGLGCASISSDVSVVENGFINKSAEESREQNLEIYLDPETTLSTAEFTISFEFEDIANGTSQYEGIQFPLVSTYYKPPMDPINGSNLEDNLENAPKNAVENISVKLVDGKSDISFYIYYDDLHFIGNSRFQFIDGEQQYKTPVSYNITFITGIPEVEPDETDALIGFRLLDENSQSENVNMLINGNGEGSYYCYVVTPYQQDTFNVELTFGEYTDRYILVNEEDDYFIPSYVMVIKT